MTCAICGMRRPRRFCPGVHGEICSLCCGTEREVTVSCPLDCPYLQDARKHDRPISIDPAQIPNRDIQLTGEFLSRNEDLLLDLARALSVAALEAGMIDADVREALDALIHTYRTLEAGVYYETRPANPLAGAICAMIQETAAQFRHAEAQSGLTKTRDADILGVLVFLQRTALAHNNGRARGRAAIDYIRGVLPAPADDPPEPGDSPLILP